MSERTFREWIEDFGECPCSLEDCYAPCPEHDKPEDDQ